MEMREDVIVYALGYFYEGTKSTIADWYHIVGVCDKDEEKFCGLENFMNLEELKRRTERIFITSIKYYESIKTFLVDSLGIDVQRIIVLSDVEHAYSVRDSVTWKGNRWIKEKLEELPYGKIIDVGAGEQRLKKYCEHLEYVSQDICEYDGKGDGKGLHLGKWDTKNIDIVCDLMDMPIDSESFDAAMCVNVLEHVPYPDKAIHEIGRILREGGTLLLIAPFWSTTHFAPYHYCSGFDIYWYEKVLQDAGLVIEEAVPAGDYYISIYKELTRLPLIMELYNQRQPDQKLEEGLATVRWKLLELSKENFQSSGAKASETLCSGYMIKARKKVKI